MVEMFNSQVDIGIEGFENFMGLSFTLNHKHSIYKYFMTPATDLLGDLIFWERWGIC